MRHTLAVLCVALAVRGLPRAGIRGQETARISGEPTCKTCSIEESLLFSVPDEVRFFDGGGTIARDAHSRYFFSSGWSKGRILVYDRGGKRIGEFGREGRGPGEYGAPRVATDGDTIHVFDPGMLRHTVLSPSFLVVRIVRMPLIDGVIFPLPGDRFVSANLQPAQTHHDVPALVVDSAGHFMHEIGVRVEPKTSDEHITMLHRPMSRPVNGRLWIAAINRYAVEQWDTAGRQMTTIQRDAGWFRPWDVFASGRPNMEQPQTQVAGIQQDQSGLLWVMIHVPDAHWKARAGNSAHVEGGGTTDRVGACELDEFYDTIVEVIDPQRGQLLASKRFPQFLYGPFIGDGVVASCHEGTDGNVVLDIHQLVFKRK